MQTLPATTEAGAPLATIQVEIDAAHDFALAEKSTATRRAYRSDFAAFTARCHARNAEPMPASPETVTAFLATQATTGAKASTISRKAAAIRYAHRLAGHALPTDTETVKIVMRGIRRTIGTAPKQKAAATADRIAGMIAGIPAETLAGKRDRALLLLGFAGAFRRSELVALTVADLIEMEGGLRVAIRHSKTDQESEGQEIAIPAGGKLRPVEAVQAWLDAAGITEGPVFRPIAKGGRLLAGALTAQSVALVIKAHAKRAGLDPAEYACRAQLARRVPDHDGGARGKRLQDDGSQPPPQRGHVARLRAPCRSVPRSRRGRFPMNHAPLRCRTLTAARLDRDADLDRDLGAVATALHYDLGVPADQAIATGRETFRPGETVPDWWNRATTDTGRASDGHLPTPLMGHEPYERKGNASTRRPRAPSIRKS